MVDRAKWSVTSTFRTSIISCYLTILVDAMHACDCGCTMPKMSCILLFKESWNKTKRVWTKKSSVFNILCADILFIMSYIGNFCYPEGSHNFRGMQVLPKINTPLDPPLIWNFYAVAAFCCRNLGLWGRFTDRSSSSPENNNNGPCW